jgi:rhodanese-related sulfurtransferase
MKTCRPILLFAAILGTSALAEPSVGRKSPPFVPPIVPAAGNVQNVSPTEVEKLIADRKDLVVLDVRTPEEFAAGHLPGAKNVDFLDANFGKNVAAFAGKPVVVHCAAGSRSAKALPVLDSKKFPQVYHLDGGYTAWASAGKPVVTEPPTAPK